ncbi:hypothetical protein OC842_007077 [Tilletia horrida]|uniref:F-box domain-containing protein n=1 Tax=Tilletia horrida TaxID=155126 RepID=A0AAN6G6Z7_9BASI|nr:hypothetical protein OC842_007077 [Tilletia horrida]
MAAAAQASKRRRIEAGAHDTFASAMTATQRFFSSSAMLRRLAQYCGLERVDLLSLALVSRALRVAAMQRWAMHLDLALSKVCIRLRLFAACPSLLALVRLVRIRNDIAQCHYNLGINEHFTTFAEQSGIHLYNSPKCAELKLRLAMLAAHVSSTSPSPIFYITVALTKVNQLSTAFEHFPKPLKPVVALRIIPDVENKMLSDLASAADRNKQTDYKRNWSTSCTKTDGLPGLRVFHFGHQDSHCISVCHTWTANVVPLSFWTTLAQDTALSLADLALDLVEADRLFIRQTATDSIDDISEWKGILDANPKLEEITVIDKTPSPSLSYKQSFPHLRWCQVERVEYVTLSSQLDFRLELVERHHGAIGTAVTQSETEITFAKHCSTAFPDDVYPKLQVLSASASMLEAHAAAGGTLSHVQTHRKLDPDLGMAWLSKYPKTAGAITCLELRQNLKPETLLPHVRALLASDLLPQLTELSLDYDSSTGMRSASHGFATSAQGSDGWRRS